MTAGGCLVYDDHHYDRQNTRVCSLMVANTLSLSRKYIAQAVIARSAFHEVRLPVAPAPDRNFLFPFLPQPDNHSDESRNPVTVASVRIWFSDSHGRAAYTPHGGWGVHERVPVFGIIHWADGTSARRLPSTSQRMREVRLRSVHKWCAVQRGKRESLPLVKGD